MLFTSPLWNQMMILIGEITVLVAIGLLFLAVVLVTIALYSIKSGKFFFPRIMSSGFFMLEGIIKAICGFFGLDDKELITFFIRVHNLMNKNMFAVIPVDKRALFLPQCLRSAKCPAHLTPEGLKCQNCGQCPIGKVLIILQTIGYRVFIVPGSSFIQRMVKKYRPNGIIGVGCIIEVKEGLEMCDRMGICGIGVMTLRDGCVETIINWHDVFDAATLGVDSQLLSKDFDVSPS